MARTMGWMESPGKEMKCGAKGTGMSWRNAAGAEAILQVRVAAL